MAWPFGAAPGGATHAPSDAGGDALATGESSCGAGSPGGTAPPGPPGVPLSAGPSFMYCYAPIHAGLPGNPRPALACRSIRAAPGRRNQKLPYGPAPIITDTVASRRLPARSVAATPTV